MPSAAPASSRQPGPSVASGTTVEFSQAARVLSREARRRQLVVPGFRCPPRVVGVQRTIRRHPGGTTVAVQVRGRPWFAVVADMIEGVVASNQLGAPERDRLRTELWAALGEADPRNAFTAPPARGGGAAGADAA